MDCFVASLKYGLVCVQFWNSAGMEQWADCGACQQIIEAVNLH